MKKILAAQQKANTKRVVLYKDEPHAEDYLQIKDHLKMAKIGKISSSTNKERPGEVLYTAPQKRMMDQYYAMQQND